MVSRITSAALKAMFGAAVACMLILSVVGLYSNGKRFGIVLTLGLLVFLAFFYAVVKKLSNMDNKWLWIALIAIGLVVRIAYAATIDIEVKSDQLACLNAAWQTVNGDFSWTSRNYFSTYAYQIPFVLYEALLLKLFGTIRILFLFNGFFSIVTCVLIYLVVKRMINKNVALITTAVFSCFPNTIFLISLLYNQIISGTFIMFGIYFFVRFCTKPEEQIRSLNIKNILLCFLSGLFIGIGNLFRTESIIVILAVEVWFVYFFVTRTNKAVFWKLLFNVLLTMAATYCAYKLINVTVDLTVTYTGIGTNGIKNGNVYWFIVCGLTPENYGAYSLKYAYIGNYTNPDEQLTVFKEILHEIFDNMSFKDIVTFFAKKMYYMWGDIDYCCVFNESFSIPAIFNIMIQYLNHFIYILLLLLGLIGIKRKETERAHSLLIIALIGFFSVYVLKEISVRYRYFTLIILVLLAAYGINRIITEQKILKLPTLRRSNL